MAAIDPTAVPEHTGITNGDQSSRATLKVIYEDRAPDGEEDETEKMEILRKLLGAQMDEDDEDDEEDEDDKSSDDEDEKNGGPSDPSKTKKARKEAAAMQMLKALRDGAEESDEEMEDTSTPPKVNGVLPKSNKGKGKAIANTDEGSDEEDDEVEDVKELVLCTLDPNQVGLIDSKIM